MRRFMSITAAAVAAAFVGLALAAAEPMELLGWGEDLDAYHYESGLISSDGAYLWFGATMGPARISKYMANPGDISPTCTSLVVKDVGSMRAACSTDHNHDTSPA